MPREANWIEESILDATPPFADIFSRDFHWSAATVNGTASESRPACCFSPPTSTASRVVGSAPDVGATNVSESKAPEPRMRRRMSRHILDALMQLFALITLREEGL